MSFDQEGLCRAALDDPVDGIGEILELADILLADFRRAEGEVHRFEIDTGKLVAQPLRIADLIDRIEPFGPLDRGLFQEVVVIVGSRIIRFPDVAVARHCDTQRRKTVIAVPAFASDGHVVPTVPRDIEKYLLAAVRCNARPAQDLAVGAIDRHDRGIGALHGLADAATAQAFHHDVTGAPAQALVASIPAFDHKTPVAEAEDDPVVEFPDFAGVPAVTPARTRRHVPVVADTLTAFTADWSDGVFHTDPFLAAITPVATIFGPLLVLAPLVGAFALPVPAFLLGPLTFLGLAAFLGALALTLFRPAAFKLLSTLTFLGALTLALLGPFTLTFLGALTLAFLGALTLAFLGALTLTFLGALTLTLFGPLTLLLLGALALAFLGALTLLFLRALTLTFLGALTLLFLGPLALLLLGPLTLTFLGALALLFLGALTLFLGALTLLFQLFGTLAGQRLCHPPAELFLGFSCAGLGQENARARLCRSGGNK